MQARKRAGEPPAATGSSTHGTPRSRARPAARRLASKRSSVSMPTFTQSAPHFATNAKTSARRTTHAGVAPHASRTSALRRAATALVMT